MDACMHACMDIRVDGFWCTCRCDEVKFEALNIMDFASVDWFWCTCRYDEVKFDRLAMIEDERLAYRRRVTHCVDKVGDLEHEYHTALVRLKKAEAGAQQRAEVQKYYEEVMEKEALKNAKALPVYRKKSKNGLSPRYAVNSAVYHGDEGFSRVSKCHMELNGAQSMVIHTHIEFVNHTLI